MSEATEAQSLLNRNRAPSVQKNKIRKPRPQRGCIWSNADCSQYGFTFASGIIAILVGCLAVAVPAWIVFLHGNEQSFVQAISLRLGSYTKCVHLVQMDDDVVIDKCMPLKDKLVLGEGVVLDICPGKHNTNICNMLTATGNCVIASIVFLFLGQTLLHLLNTHVLGRVPLMSVHVAVAVFDALAGTLSFSSVIEVRRLSTNLPHELKQLWGNGEYSVSYVLALVFFFLVVLTNTSFWWTLYRAKQAAAAAEGMDDDSEGEVDISLEERA